MYTDLLSIPKYCWNLLVPCCTIATQSQLLSNKNIDISFCPTFPYNCKTLNKKGKQEAKFVMLIDTKICKRHKSYRQTFIIDRNSMLLLKKNILDLGKFPRKMPHIVSNQSKILKMFKVSNTKQRIYQ